MMALSRISEDAAACPPSAFSSAASASASVRSSGGRSVSSSVSRKSSSTAASRGTSRGGGASSSTVTPDLYRAALNRKWSTIISRATTHPEEARYVNPADGLTALHLAVISRVVPTTQSFGRKAASSASSASGKMGASSSESGRLRNSHGAEIPGLTGRIKSPAPMDAVRALLVAHPDGALLRDRRSGYTPLAYACLVAPPPKEGDEDGGGDDYTVSSAYSTKSRSTVYASFQRDSYGILEEAEKLVRLLLRHRPECTSVLTDDGLSPLDVHIVSYSVGWGAEENEGGAAGRTSSGVLRTLLETDPTLARSRVRRDGGGETIGPLELLYKYNAGGFLGTLAAEEEKVKTARGAMVGLSTTSGGAASMTVSQRKRKDEGMEGIGGANSARSTLSSWWVWKWSILLLKYLHHKRGRKFQAVHAAASVPGCPLPLLMLAVRAFPNQIREADEYGGDGNMPLHMVASWGRPPPPHEYDDDDEEYPRALALAAAAADPITASRRGMVLSELLTEYSLAARVRNVEGKTPLALALESGAGWHTGVRRLVRAFPDALYIRDETTFLMPFMAAACAPTAFYGQEDGEEQGDAGASSRSVFSRNTNDRKLTATVYELLRSEPLALVRFVPGWTMQDIEEAVRLYGRRGGGRRGRRRKDKRRKEDGMRTGAR